MQVRSGWSNCHIALTFLLGVDGITYICSERVAALVADYLCPYCACMGDRNSICFKSFVWSLTSQQINRAKGLY